VKKETTTQQSVTEAPMQPTMKEASPPLLAAPSQSPFARERPKEEDKRSVIQGLAYNSTTVPRYSQYQ